VLGNLALYLLLVFLFSICMCKVTVCTNVAWVKHNKKVAKAKIIILDYVKDHPSHHREEVSSGYV
jgi:hypothetical protein